MNVKQKTSTLFCDPQHINYISLLTALITALRCLAITSRTVFKHDQYLFLFVIRKQNSLLTNYISNILNDYPLYRNANTYWLMTIKSNVFLEHYILESFFADRLTKQVFTNFKHST